MQPTKNIKKLYDSEICGDELSWSMVTKNVTTTKSRKGEYILFVGSQKLNRTQ